MNKEELLNKFPDYEECGTLKECEIDIFYDIGNIGFQKRIFLRKKSKFPVIVEDDYLKILVYEVGDITISEKNYNTSIFVKRSLPILEQALNESKKLRGLK
jgi:hypothetical protein